MLMIKRVSVAMLLVSVALSSGCVMDVSEESAALTGELPMPRGLAHGAVNTLTHSIRVGPHRYVVVRESFSRASFQRTPRRADLFLTGTPTTGAFANIPVD